MLRRHVVLLLLLFTSACLWRGYEKILLVHVDVLTATADKLSGVVSTGHGLTTQGMTEYIYPAQRARQFLGQFDKHSARPSYAGLRNFLDRYEAMVAEVDAARPSNTVDPDKVQREVAALHKLATQIRADVAAGR